MRYFHRTALSLPDALDEADAFLGGRLDPVERGHRMRAFKGVIGTIHVSVRAEGGHYTLVTVSTDQVAESEADKLAKRYLARVHRRYEPSHELRGAY